MGSPPDDNSTVHPSREDTRPFLADAEFERLAQYRVIKQLGKGGMGLVLQAEDEQLRRIVALKVMRGDYAQNQEAKSRFLREARAAAAIKHDNIVTIYQVGEDHGIPFLAMEFLKGKPLDEWLRPDRRATVLETLGIGKQAIRGLMAAHEAGLVHRDIKPANLWLESPSRRVKVLDFGLARGSDGEFTEITQQGAILGTPAYMAPEQMRGEQVDHRCDLFSFGCVLYRMTTGRLPFQGNTVFAVMAAVMTETPPPVDAINPSMPGRLSGLIARLLSKDARDRPNSARAVLEELLAIEKEAKARAEAPSGEIAPQAVTEGSNPRAEILSAQTILLPPTEVEVEEIPVEAGGRSWGITIAALIAVTVVTAGSVAFFARDSIWPGKSEATADDGFSGKKAPPSSSKPERINLLALIDTDRDRKAGTWVLKTIDHTKAGAPIPPETHLSGRLDEDHKRGFFLALPYMPPSRYKLSFQVSRRGSKDGGLGVGLVLDRTFFEVRIDDLLTNHAGKQGLYTGVTFIADKALMDRTAPHATHHLPQNERVEVVCTVTPEEVLVTVDGTTVIRRTEQLERMHRRGPVKVPLFFQGTGPASFFFSNVYLEPLGDDRGHPTR